MLLNNATMDALYTGFNTRFQQGFARAPQTFKRIAMEVPSTTKMETYAWLMLLSRMREWIGPRQIQNVDKRVMQIINRVFEHTVGLDRDDIADEININTVGLLIEAMGMDYEYLPQRLVIDALVGNANWLDGAAFFVANRKYGKSTIKNYVTGALTETTFNTAYQEMLSYCGFDGSPMGVVPDLLVVGPKLRTTAFEILKAQNKISIAGSNTAAAAVQNPNQGLCEYLVLPELVGTYDDYWFLTQTTGVVKPVVYQDRERGPLTRWDTEKDECVKNHNRNDYGCKRRGAAAPTLPHLIYGGFVA